MSLKETISQNLAPANVPYVNGVSVKRTFSKAFLEAVAQGEIEKDGRGVTQRFTPEDVVNESAQIAVNRVVFHIDAGREHGSAKNGGMFNKNQRTSSTVTEQIEVLQYFDEPIIIGRSMQDRINVDLASAEIANYVKSINLALNGSSFAAKWLATYLAPSAKRNVTKIGVGDKVLDKYLAANAKLNKGDMDNDIDYFEIEGRIATFKENYYDTLLAGGVLTIGGANYGYDIARKGTLDAESAKVDLGTGYWGTVGGVPIHGISDMSLRSAAWFCGMPDEEFYDGTAILGVISAAEGNARGVSYLNQIEIDKYPFGQGVVINPMTKLGAKTWYQKANSWLTAEDYDPIADLKAMFSGVAGSITFKLKAKGSRFYADADITAISTTAFTVTATALDDANTDHVLAAYYAVTAAPITKVADFVKVRTDAGVTYKGAVTTIGTSQSTTIADKDYVTVLVIADDGSCTLVSKQYNA